MQSPAKRTPANTCVAIQICETGLPRIMRGAKVPKVTTRANRKPDVRLNQELYLENTKPIRIAPTISPGKDQSKNKVPNTLGTGQTTVAHPPPKIDARMESLQDCIGIS